MPHTPRQYASTVGISPELLARPSEQHRPMPMQQAPADEAQKPRRVRLGLGKLNLRTYEPDIKKVCEALLGKEVSINEHTGELVPAARRPDAAGNGKG